MDDITVECNTDNQTLASQIAENSRLPIDWIDLVEAHDGHAVIVGSGPSVADCLDTIRWRQSIGQKVFALNGASRYLSENGIRVDYSVMVDAREENKFFLGFAEHYLLSAQCHPTLFRKTSGKVTLWQPYIPDLKAPETDRAYTQIGGGTTVGLSAMCLAYTMGYRKLHLFGYDSSYREDKGHAFRQDLNRNDSCCYVTLDGVRYKASIAMAKQAELFPILSNDLLDKGCTITVDGDGLLPAVVRRQPPLPEPELTEQAKYQRMWEFAAYRAVSPGELVAQTFVDVVNPIPKDRIIDFGCGTGRGTLALHRLTQCELVQVDFAANCRDPEAEWLPLMVCDMTEKIPVLGDYGFCADVMEHIEPEKVDQTLRNIMHSGWRVFFQISTVPDHCGALIGHPLHLTVQPHSWWREKFLALGYAVQWEQEEDQAALFYVTQPLEARK